MKRYLLQVRLSTLQSLLAFGACFMLTGCDFNASEESTPTPIKESVDPALTQSLTNAYLKNGEVALEAFEQSTQQLLTAVKTLLDTPNDQTLAKARDFWRKAYHASVMAYLYSPTQLSSTDAAQTLIDNILVYPIQGGYIDYLDNYPNSGLVFHTGLPITSISLTQQHLMIDDQSATFGLHVIEFLLWGEHGHRSASDFVKASAPVSADAVVMPPPEEHEDNAEDALPLEEGVDPHVDNMPLTPAPTGLLANNRRRDFLLTTTSQLKLDAQKWVDLAQRPKIEKVLTKQAPAQQLVFISDAIETVATTIGDQQYVQYFLIDEHDSWESPYRDQLEADFATFTLNFQQFCQQLLGEQDTSNMPLKGIAFCHQLNALDLSQNTKETQDKLLAVYGLFNQTESIESQ